MSRWNIVRIALDITIAFLGIYCLTIGEQKGCATIIGVLLLEACRGNLIKERKENG